MTKIDVLCNDGSPLGVTMKTLMGTDEKQVGCGGAEYSLLTLCEAWHNAGHEVILFNDPREQNASPFEQRPIGAFDPFADRDILIVFRSPNPRAIAAKGLKTWWSCDQFTNGSFKQFAPMVDKIVCISPFHQKYFADTYGIVNTLSIDLPVRNEYQNLNGIEKVPNRFIFTSVPARGLENLWRMWPQIKNKIPDASVVITSDYRLWGTGDPGSSQYRVQWMSRNDVEFLGAVPRPRLVEEELKADIMLYTSNYEELFCISVAEAQVAGIYTITPNIGALSTTNMCKVFQLSADDPRTDVVFVDHCVEVLKDRMVLQTLQYDTRWKAINRFSIDKILSEWETRVFNG